MPSERKKEKGWRTFSVPFGRPTTKITFVFQVALRKTINDEGKRKCVVELGMFRILSIMRKTVATMRKGRLRDSFIP